MKEFGLFNKSAEKHLKIGQAFHFTNKLMKAREIR